jgi:hypothetical protein
MNEVEASEELQLAPYPNALGIAYGLIIGWAECVYDTLVLDGDGDSLPSYFTSFVRAAQAGEPTAVDIAERIDALGPATLQRLATAFGVDLAVEDEG